MTQKANQNGHGDETPVCGVHTVQTKAEKWN